MPCLLTRGPSRDAPQRKGWTAKHGTEYDLDDLGYHDLGDPHLFFNHWSLMGRQHFMGNFLGIFPCQWDVSEKGTHVNINPGRFQDGVQLAASNSSEMRFRKVFAKPSTMASACTLMVNDAECRYMFISSLKSMSFAMEVQLVIGFVAFFGGWICRGLQQQPVPLPNPCACHCGCECISTGSSFGPIIVTLVCLVSTAGGIAFWFLSLKVHPEPFYQPKGKKGSYGVSGNVLTITGWETCSQGTWSWYAMERCRQFGMSDCCLQQCRTLSGWSWRQTTIDILRDWTIWTPTSLVLSIWVPMVSPQLMFQSGKFVVSKICLLNF